MHNLLLENQDALEDQDLLAYAEGLNLEIERFKKDMTSEEIAKKIKDDFMSGVKSGVNGTPTFFINGIRFDGPSEVISLRKAIELTSKHKKKGGASDDST